MRVVVNRTIKNIVKMKYKDGTLYVLANILITRNRLKKIIEENSEWIKSKKAEATPAPKENNKSELQNNSAAKRGNSKLEEQQQIVKDMFAGRKTLVLGDIVNVEPSMSSKTYLDGGHLYVSEKYYNDKELRIKAIKSYLKKIAFLFVASEVSAFGTGVSLCPQKIEFKDIGDCWCKCSLAAQKILCFDYRITQLPQPLRNYVIAHAFAHFQFATHDDAFWNHISNIIPHYEDVETQLKNYDFLKDI